MKLDNILQEIIKDILTPNLYKSGNKFITSTELCQKYGVSHVSALTILNKLCSLHYLLPIRDKKYIINGLAHQDSDFSLAHQKSNLIAILIPDITNPFFVRVVKDIFYQASLSEYSPIIQLINKDTEADVLLSMLSLGAIGIITFNLINKDNLDLFKRFLVPIITIDEHPLYEGATNIATDNYTSGFYAARHLTGMGYTSLYTCDTAIRNSKRLQGFKDFAINNHFSFSEAHQLIIQQNNPFENNKLLETIKNDPNRIGIFCYHDLIANQVYHLCKKNGIDIPQKVGIIGYDALGNYDESLNYLTTFEYSFSTIAHATIAALKQILLQRRHIGTVTPTTTTFIRKSTTVAPN